MGEIGNPGGLETWAGWRYGLIDARSMGDLVITEIFRQDKWPLGYHGWHGQHLHLININIEVILCLLVDAACYDFFSCPSGFLCDLSHTIGTYAAYPLNGS